MLWLDANTTLNQSYLLFITLVNMTYQSGDHYLPSIHSCDSSPWQVLYIPLFCFVCVFVTACRVVLVFFKCVINLTSFLFKSRFISLLLFFIYSFIYLFISFWLSNFFHMKRLRLVDYFVCLFRLLSWNCRVRIHNFSTFLPFPKYLQCSSFISILT